MTLATHITQLSRVGKTLEKRLKYLKIVTVRDLLFHFPFRYEDFRAVRPIASLTDGGDAAIHATVELIASKRSPRKRMMITEAVVADETGQMRVIWFNQPYIGHAVKAGDWLFFFGKVKSDMLGPVFVSPRYEKEARLVPLYPLTNGVTQKQMRFLVCQALAVVDELKEWLPLDVRKRAHILPLPNAVRAIHAPKDDDERTAGERRLKFDELFLLQLKAEAVRRSLATVTAPAIQFPEVEVRAFVAGLSYMLTKDQKIAAWEILKDMGRGTPMNRLLQGDVGCGKTVVAGIAAYAVCVRGLKTIIMAPTEILAFQHYETLRALFETIGVTVGLMTRSRKTVEGCTIIVGTHALLSDDISFSQVGLVVVDEQHRFGVEQRGRIRGNAHFLSMTATPIPRSLALTLYGDLDVSIIRTMPTGRVPVRVRLVAPHERILAYQFIREEIGRGRQAFVICPLIEESDEKKSVLVEFKKLSEKVFYDLRVGFLHGKLKPKEKEETMRAFAAGDIDVLVSTSVVEVGVDIPNASVMMIEGAERFGLAQLHQFRGRVGRSTHQSYCLVFPEDASIRAMERLLYFAKTTDGFALAEYDLQVRGPGEVYGKEQSGMMQLRLATLRDVELIHLARDIARDLPFEKYPTILEKLAAWEASVHLE